jgi:hypothetical protein
MAIPSSVKSATTRNYVSALDAVLGLHKPEVSSEFVQKYGDQNLQGFLSATGAMNAVSQPEYHHYEEDWLHEIVQGTATAGAAGATVTLTLGASTKGTLTNDASPYMDAADTTVYLPRLNDILRFKDGTLGMVTSISSAPTSIDVTPLVAADNIPTVIAADEIIVIGNAYGEQTGQPEARNSSLSLYTNNLQIMKSSDTVSGTEAASKVWIEVKDPKSGKKGYLWYLQSCFDEYRRFMNEVEMTLLISEKSDNASNLSDLTAVTTEGLIPFIESNGSIQSYTSGSLTRANLESLVTTIDRNRGARENTMWTGITLSLEIDALMGTELAAGAFVFGQGQGKGEHAVDFGFQSFTLGGYTFHKKAYDMFTYQKGLGATDHGFTTYGMIIPADQVAEGKSRIKVPSLRCNYLKGEGNDYSRSYEEWVTGGANGVYNSTIDEINVHRRVHRGFEGFAGNRFAALKV